MLYKLKYAFSLICNVYSVEDIKSDFYNRRISKKETIKLLISIIESLEDEDFNHNSSEILKYWDAIDAQIEAIKTFRQLNLKNEEIYKLMENLVISESNSNIKITTIKEIAELFPDKSRELLKWIFENDILFKYMDKNWSSALVYDALNWSNNKNFREIQEKLEKIVRPRIQAYVLEGVNSIEAKILTIFELQLGFKLIKAEDDFFKKLCPS